MSVEVPSPMEQFNVLRIVPLHFGDIDVSFTNSSLWMMIAVAFACGFFFFATRGRALIPGRVQSVAELIYQFVADMVQDAIGSEGRRFFPYIFTLFVFILIINLFGLIPSIPGSPHEFHVFTPTSHIIITFALAMVTITMVLVYGFYRNGLGFLRLLAPSGVPMWLLPLIVLIEFFSFLSRPLSLSIRLFANMFAGHLIIKVFAGFIISLLGAGAWAALAPAPFLGVVAVLLLEILIAALQAYVFAILSCIYLNDAVHVGH